MRSQIDLWYFTRRKTSFYFTRIFIWTEIRERVFICLNGIEIRQRILHDLSQCVKVNRYDHYNIRIANNNKT